MSSTRSPSPFDAVAEFYDETYSTPADLADSDVIFARARALARKVPGTFIDLGCGTGIALDWNVCPPDWYVGIDPSEGMIRVAGRRHLREMFSTGDDRNLPDWQAGFILGGFGPLQYVEPERLTEFSLNVHDGLRVGGRFLLMGRAQPRETRITGGRSYVYGPETLSAAFAWARGLRVRGHRRWTGERLSRDAQRWALRAEGLLRPDPETCEWIVIEGQR